MDCGEFDSLRGPVGKRSKFAINKNQRRSHLEHPATLIAVDIYSAG